MEIVTVSRNKITGDRSYTDGIYQVIGRNDTHISLWRLDRKTLSESFGKPKAPLILSIDEHDFMDARPLLNKDQFSQMLRIRGIHGLPSEEKSESPVVVNILA